MPETIEPALLKADEAAIDEVRTIVDAIESRLQGHPFPDAIRRVLLQRDANCFSPLHGGSRVAEAAYTVSPFVIMPIFDTFEAYNYAAAQQYAFEHCSDDPLTVESLCAIHSILLPEEHLSGQLRAHNVWIGRPGVTAAEARVILAPPDRIGALIDDLFAFTNTEVGPNMVIAALAMFHYQLTAIHPFQNANGRITRILTAVLATRFKITSDTLLLLGEEFMLQRAEYMMRISAVDYKRDVDGWVSFFHRIVAKSAHNTLALVERAMSLFLSLVDSLSEFSELEIAYNVASDLLLTPLVQISSLLRSLNLREDQFEPLIDTLRRSFSAEIITAGGLLQIQRIHKELAL